MDGPLAFNQTTHGRSFWKRKKGQAGRAVLLGASSSETNKQTKHVMENTINNLWCQEPLL